MKQIANPSGACALDVGARSDGNLFDESDGNLQTSPMTTTLDLPDDLVEDIHLRAEQEGRGLDETVAQLLRAGLAVSSSRTTTAVHATASMLEERKRIAEKFLTGEWGADLTGFEEGRVADRDAAQARDRAWRR
jgi:plasmid stability protein